MHTIILDTDECVTGNDAHAILYGHTVMAPPSLVRLKDIFGIDRAMMVENHMKQTITENYYKEYGKESYLNSRTNTYEYESHYARNICRAYGIPESFIDHDCIPMKPLNILRSHRFDFISANGPGWEMVYYQISCNPDKVPLEAMLSIRGHIQFYELEDLIKFKLSEY